MKALKNFTDLKVDNMGLAIEWYANPIIQAAVGAIAGGYTGSQISHGSASATEVCAGIGMIGLPLTYHQGAKFHEFLATNSTAQKVIQTISRFC